MFDCIHWSLRKITVILNINFHNGFKHWYIEQILLNFFYFNVTGSIDDKLTHVGNGIVPIANKPSPALTLNKLYEAISCYLGWKITVNVTPGTSKLIIPFCVYPSNSGFMNLRYTNLVITEYTVLRFIYRWLSARLQYLQCVSNGDTAVLYLAIDLRLEIFVHVSFLWTVVFNLCWPDGAILNDWRDHDNSPQRQSYNTNIESPHSHKDLARSR